MFEEIKSVAKIALYIATTSIGACVGAGLALIGMERFFE